MRTFVSLPALGVLLAAGIAGGFHLGESAVAEIDPVHFRGPAIHPRERGVAIDPNEVRPAEPRYASLYGWDDAAEAVPADHVADGFLPPDRDPVARDVAETAEAVAAVVERSGEWAEEALAEAEDALAEAEGSVDWEEVERYAYYPVSAEEAGPWDESEGDDPYSAGGL